jgi:hypothetical protein
MLPPGLVGKILLRQSKRSNRRMKIRFLRSKPNSAKKARQDLGSSGGNEGGIFFNR